MSDIEEIPKLIDSSPEALKEGIKDIDLRTVDKDIINKILKKISARSAADVENADKIYILITNPKGGIDINSKIYNNYLLEWFINTDDVGKFKHLIENYNPKFNIITTHGIRLGTKLLYSCIYYDRYNVAELLLGYMTIHRTDGLMKYLYTKNSMNDAADFYKLFIRRGLSIDEVIDKNTGYTSLMQSIEQSRKDKFDFFIEQRAYVNYLTKDNYTPLRIAIIHSKNNTYYTKKLLENAADVHFIFPKITMEDGTIFQNLSLLQEVIYEGHNIENVKLLLEYGADKNHKETTTHKTALDIAKDKYENNKKYYRDVIKLLGGKMETELWKGFSRSDIQKFDIFFENPFDWSCCPICLEYIERSAACMYMSHNCATTGHYYHEKLYDAYMYDYGKKQVEWCTVCGRITELHKHFKLTDAKNPNKTKAPLKPEIQAQLDRGDNVAFFDNANCIGFGGGGIEEKAERFRRLREYALTLQEDVGKKNYDDVMEKLIEVVWDSALVKSEKVKNILKNKSWNINVTAFPENKKNTRNNNSNSNAANVPFGGRVPTVIEGGDCIIYADDEEGEASNPTYQFHHSTVGGKDHDGIYICQKDLAKAVQLKCKEFGLEDFGQCWFSPCKAILHPEELKGIIPEVLYTEYKKKFNKKMVAKGGRRPTRKLKKQKGGDVKSVLHELEDGTCTPHNWTRDGKLRK